MYNEFDNVSEEVWNRACGQVWKQANRVWRNTYDLKCGQIYSYGVLKDRVYIPVHDQIWSPVYSQVRDQIWDEMGDNE